MSRILTRILALALTASLTLATAASAQQAHFASVPAKDHSRHNPLAGNPEATSAGAKLYTEHCAECHQADARGDGNKKPSLRTSEVRSATDGDLEWFLRQGDLRHGMPSWSSLSEAKRWAIISYLRSLQ